MNPLDTTVLLHTESIGSGPDIVILHGLFGSGENWGNQARMLAEHFTVHSMDARNHGASEHRPSINYPAMAADVIATCEQLELTRVNLLGHSMGGKTAMQICLTKPALVERVIIVDIAPRQYPHHHDQIIKGLTTLHQHDSDSRRTADKILSDYVEDKMIRAFLLKNLQRTENNTYRLRINIEAISHCYSDIAAAIASPSASDGYQAPALFIKGAESDYLQTTDRAAVLSLFPQATVKSIAGAGHWPHSEKPDVVFKIIHDFFDQSIDA